MMNAIKKKKSKLIGFLLRHYQFITIIMKVKINSKRIKKYPINTSLKKYSKEPVLPHINNLKRRQMTDVNGHNKVWRLLEVDDDKYKF